MTMKSNATPSLSGEFEDIQPAWRDPPPRGPVTRARPGREPIMASIRAAAITEFSLHGLWGTSTQAIATRAGLTKQQLHYYIAGKEELYDELLLGVVRDWEIDFSLDGRASDPATVLGRYIRQKLDYAMDNPEISRIFTREVLDGGDNLSRYWPLARLWTKAKLDIIDQWIARGQMRPLDGRLLLVNIWTTTQCYADYAQQTRIWQALPGDKPKEREAIAQDLVRLVLTGCAL